MPQGFAHSTSKVHCCSHTLVALCCGFARSGEPLISLCF